MYKSFVHSQNETETLILSSFIEVSGIPDSLIFLMFSQHVNDQLLYFVNLITVMINYIYIYIYPTDYKDYKLQTTLLEFFKFT